MAEVEDVEASGGKGGLIKIILIVLLVLIVAIGSALGSLFVTGFFDAPEEDAAEQAIAELEAEIENTESAQHRKGSLKRLRKKKSLNLHITHFLRHLLQT